MKANINSNLIKEYLSENLLSKRAFCKKANISLTTLRNLEKNVGSYNLNTLLNVAEALEINLGKLIKKTS